MIMHVVACAEVGTVAIDLIIIALLLSYEIILFGPDDRHDV